MRVLPFYQVQFGWLDETSGFLPTFHVESSGFGCCRHVPLSRQVRFGPGVGKAASASTPAGGIMVPALPH
jgi:hypothetical protein